MSVVVPSPVADPAANTAAIQRAIDATPYGGVLQFPCGNWTVAGTGSELFLRTTPITILGEGMGSMISLDPSVGPKTDLFRFAPSSDGGSGYNWRASGLMIRRDKQCGRNAFTLDTNAKGSFLQNLRITDNYCEPLGGYFVATKNDNDGEGLFCSTIADNILSMGISLLNSGDSNRILRNTIGGATEGILLGCRGTAGGVEIIGNNLTTAKSGIVVLAGRAIAIMRNQLEQQVAPTGAHPCLIDLAGTTSRIQHPKIFANVAQTGNGSPFSPEPDVMRLGCVDDAWIEANTFTMTRAAGIRITPDAKRPCIGKGNVYIDGVPVYLEKSPGWR